MIATTVDVRYCFEDDNRQVNRNPKPLAAFPSVLVRIGSICCMGKHGGSGSHGFQPRRKLETAMITATTMERVAVLTTVLANTCSIGFAVSHHRFRSSRVE